MKLVSIHKEQTWKYNVCCVMATYGNMYIIGGKITTNFKMVSQIYI